MTVALDIFKELLAHAGAAPASVAESVVSGQETVNAELSDDAWVGRDGDVVRAFDHLVKKIAEKKTGEDRLQVLIDIDGYRAGLIRELVERSQAMAERAVSFKYDVEMHPMSAYERLIVHTALADTPHVKTESTGEGRDRRVVIRYVE
jgi:spoIIIJ-associated protein